MTPRHLTFFAPAALLLALACGCPPAPQPVAARTASVADSASAGPADTDGDGLPDAREAELGTSPLVQDSDADGYSDADEVVVKAFNPEANNYLFNPLIADLPQVSVIVMSSPSIKVVTTTTTGERVSHGVERTSTTGQSSRSTTGGAYSSAVENQVSWGVSATVGSELEAGLTGPSVTASASLTVEASQTSSSTRESTVNWSKEQSREKSQALSALESFESSADVSEVSATFEILATIVNSGPIACTVEDVLLTAYTLDPLSPDVQTPVSNLKVSGGFASNTIVPGEELGPLVFSAETSVDTAKQLLANPSGLIVQAPGVELLGPDRMPFAHNMTGVGARTARVIVDYGPLPPPGSSQAVEDYRVCVVTPDGKGVPAGTVLRDVLKLDYELDSRSWAAAPGGEAKPLQRGLVAVRGLALDPETRAYWTVAHTHTINHGIGTQTDTYDVIRATEDFDLDALPLRPGDVLRLVRIVDHDDDGLGERAEFRYGTDPSNPDTDGDGLSDRTEVMGWLMCGKLRVQSNPLVADTDGDGLSDREEYELREQEPLGSFHPSDDGGLFVHYPLDAPGEGDDPRLIRETVSGREARAIGGMGSLKPMAFTPKYVPAYKGEGLRLKGTNFKRSQIKGPHIPFGRNGRPFTICLWTKFDPADGPRRVRLVGQEGWINLRLDEVGLLYFGPAEKGLDAGGVSLLARDPETGQGFTPLQTGEWVFLAGTYADRKLNLYAFLDRDSDGQVERLMPAPVGEAKVDHSQATLPEPLANPGQGLFTLGEWAGEHPVILDDVRVYSRALTPEQLAVVASKRKR